MNSKLPQPNDPLKALLGKPISELRFSSEFEIASQDVREMLLAESERLAQMGSWYFNLDTSEIHWSDGLYRILGMDSKKQQASLETFFQCLHPLDKERLKSSTDKLLQNKSPNAAIVDEFRFLRNDGSIREVVAHSAFVSPQGSKERRMVGAILDVTERRKADREVERSASMMGEAQRLANLGSWYWDVDTDRLECSEELLRILGVDPNQFINMEFFDSLIHEEEKELFVKQRDEVLHGRQSPHTDFRITRPDGSIRFVASQAQAVELASGSTRRLFGIILDNTERRGLEEQLKQSQKMEALGRLAGGVAHDFNNLLTLILGNAHLLNSKFTDEKLKQIIQAAELGASLTQRLLAFTRQTPSQPTIVNLNKVTLNTGKVVERVLGNGVTVKYQLASDLHPIRIDSSQVQQILLNLAANAKDAMEGKGTLTITTTNETLDKTVSGTGGYSGRPGEYAVLGVSDTGTGMDEKTQTRIFEPFFTTKDPGKGTGLGLSTVFGVVSQGGGFIQVKSSPGKGTQFHLYFPAIHFENQISPQKTLKPKEQKQGTIFLIEDNAAVRDLVREFLLVAGYKVYAVDDLHKIDEQWERHRPEVDLLLSDMVMPGENGKSISKRLLASKPDLKVLFISGYAHDESGSKMTSGPFLQKPFTQAQLVAAVDEALH